MPDGYFGVELPDSRTVGGYDAIEFAKPYQHVVQVLYRTALRLHAHVLGFSDMSVEAVARECGLTLLQARLAKLREYDEPFRLVHDDLQVERRLLRALTTLYRSRFGAVVTVAAGGDAMRRGADVSLDTSSTAKPQDWLDGVLHAVREIPAREAAGALPSY